MKLFLLAMTILVTMNVAFAETYICNFRHQDSSYRLKFEFDRNMDDAQVTIYRSNKVQISHTTTGRSDGFGDGWDLKLTDSKHRQYKYHLWFNAMSLETVDLTMPGLKNFEVDSCRRIRI